MILPRLASSAQTNDDRTLVVVNLRGAADLWGSMCPPVADPLYQSERASLAISDPTAMGSTTAWLNWSQQPAVNRFGLAGSALGLQTAIADGKLALVSGVGLPNVGRSHFEAMREVEYGIDAGTIAPAGAAGWGGGLLNQAMPTNMAPVRGLAHGGLLPTVLSNGDRVQAVKDVANLAFPGDLSTAYPIVSGATTGGSTPAVPFASLYRQAIELAHTGTGTVEAAGAQAIDAFDYLDNITYSALPGTYPPGPFSDALHKTAVLLQTTAPRPEMIHIDFGGWDHHENQGAAQSSGLFWGMCKGLTDALGAFHAEMKAAGQPSGEWCLMVYSEFGRRLRTNSALGTDHGHGNAMILMGDAVGRGAHAGTIYAEYGTLGSAPTMSEGLTSTTPGDQDLVIDVDYRDVLREYMLNSLAMTDTEITAVFHGWTSSRTQPLNLLL